MSELATRLYGLSFAARAVYATSLAISFETGSAHPPVKEIAHALGLSDAAMDAAIEELYSAGAAWRSGDTFPDLTGLATYQTDDFLSRSPGPSGRPKAAEWTVLRERTFAEKGNLCLYCRADATAVDHLLPVDRGGSNHPVNLGPACGTCNSSKGKKTYEEWRALGGGIR